MNKIKTIKNIALVAGVLLSTASCVNNQDFEIPNVPRTDCIESEPTATLDDIYAKAGATTTQIEEDLSFTGYVISSDQHGGFYKEIVLQNAQQNATKGLVLSVEIKGIYDYFPVGRKIKVDAKGLYIALDNGLVKIGGPQGKYPIERLEAKTAMNHIHLMCGESTVTPKTFTSIAEAKKDENLNTLIKLEGVQFKDANGKKTYYDKDNAFGGATNIVIEDREGNKLDLRNGKHVDWAKEILPNGSGSITVVLSKFKTSYQAYIRDLNDVQLNGERFTIGSNPNEGGNTEAVALEARTATINDFTKGKKVTLHGNITVKQGRTYIVFGDGTEIQLYTKGFRTLSQEVKDKLNTQGQELTITGTFGEFKGTKQIEYKGASDLVFGAADDNNNPSGGENNTPVAGKIFDFESLTEAPSKSYKETGSLTATDGTTLNFVGRTDLDNYAISGKGLMISKDKGYIKITFPNGVKNLSFDYKSAYTNKSNRKIVIYEGDDQSTNKIGEKSFATNTDGHYSLSLNKTGAYTLTIKAMASQVVLDNIAWDSDDNGSAGDGQATPSPAEETVAGTFDFEGVEEVSNDKSEGSLAATDGSTLNYRARTGGIGNYRIEGKGLMLKSDKESFVTITFKGGIKSLTFSYKGAYNKGKNRKIQIFEGDVNSTTKLTETESFSDLNKVHTFKYTFNKTEDYTITIKEVDSPAVVIDNVSWTR